MPDGTGELKRMASERFERGFVKVPVDAIGRLLDGGRSSIAALHLLAIKCAYPPTWSLSEGFVRRQYGIGRHRFRSGIDRLKKTGVLSRVRRDRGYCTEQINFRSPRFVPFPRRLLRQPSTVVAMVLVTFLSPTPTRRNDAAHRLGIRSATTVRELTNAVIATGAVAWVEGKHGEIHFGRPLRNLLNNFPPDENVPANLDGTSRIKMKDTNEITTLRPSSEAPLALDRLLQLAKDDVRLLLWAVEGDVAREHAELAAITIRQVAEIVAVASDEQLAQRIGIASRGRISPVIVSAAGLTAVRAMVALVVRERDEDPADALDTIIDAIDARIGQRGDAYLNSLALIGMRLTAALFHE